MTRKNVAYLRLSRPDEDAPGTTDEKLQGQLETCHRLAREHDLAIHEVLTETVSGGTLAGRPELLRLLLLCKRGEIGTIFCTFADRLSRLDGRDRADFEEALTDGSVTVITTQGVTRYDHEEEPFARRVLAEAAAYELRAYSRRLKERKHQKIMENKRAGGAPGYGYERDPAAPGGYRSVAHEYPILCRILRGILAHKSAYGIASELTAEGIPPPGHVHTRQSGRWHQTTIMRIALNPFNAGRHAQRVKQVKQGSKKSIRTLRPDEFVIAPNEGEWEHPLTWEEYCQIRASFSERYRPHPPSGLLTGLLYCDEGGRMARMGPGRYQCFCEREGRVKRGVIARTVEDAARDALEYALLHLPPDALGTMSPRRDRAELFNNHAKAQRAVRDAFTSLDELARRSQWFIDLMGQDAYEESLRRAGQAHSAAKQEEAYIAGLLSEPAVEEIEPVLCAVRNLTFERVWAEATNDEKRTLLHTFIERIQLAPKGRNFKHHKAPAVTYKAWVTERLPL